MLERVLLLASRREMHALPLQLSQFHTREAARIPDYPAEAASALLTVLPLVFVSLRIERYVVQGIISGSSK